MDEQAKLGNCSVSCPADGISSSQEIRSATAALQSAATIMMDKIERHLTSPTVNPDDEVMQAFDAFLTTRRKLEAAVAEIITPLVQVLMASAA